MIRPEPRHTARLFNNDYLTFHAVDEQRVLLEHRWV